MRLLRTQWPVAVLSAGVAVLATLLVLDAPRRERGIAFGQVSEGATANYMIGMLGEQNNDRRPLFLIDTKAQTIMLYEYFDSQRILLFRVARSYASDREVQDAVFYDQSNLYKGPSVRDIQSYLREAARGTPTPAPRGRF
jgi:hypothetical protein